MPLSRPQVSIPPVLLCIVSVGLLTVMNGAIKGVVAHYDGVQVAFVRYAAGSVWIGLVVLWLRPGWPARDTALINLARGVLGMISGTTFFMALGLLNLADAFTVGFVAPLFVPLLALIVLKERPRRVDLIALALGFIGMLIIVRTGANGAGPRSLYGVGLVVISAATYAATLIMLRFLAQKDPIVLLVIFQHLVSAVILAPVMLFLWGPMAMGDVAVIAVASLLGVAGHLMMAHAFSRAEASRLVPIEYTALLYAAIIDFVWFGHAVAPSTLLGAAAIILGALLASRR